MWHSMVQRERGGKEGLLFFINSLRCISPPVASRTCDLEAKQIIKKKQLIICKCPNSVHLESIVEKEEKLIN